MANPFSEPPVHEMPKDGEQQSNVFSPSDSVDNNPPYPPDPPQQGDSGESERTIPTIPTTEGETKPDVKAEVLRLAAMDELNYAQTRKAEAIKLGIGVTALDKFVKESRPKEEQEKKKGGGIGQNIISDDVVELLKGKVAYSGKFEQFYYRKDKIWKEVDKTIVHGLVDRCISRDMDSYPFALITGVTNFLTFKLRLPKETTAPHLIPLSNGVYNLKTRQLEDYGKYNFWWSLPYAYDESATCPTVKRWLLQVVSGDRDVIKVLLAWMYAVLTGQYKLQKYIELIGTGGAGKSTFLRICTDLVGGENTATTDLKQLENNNFESSMLKGKRLALITDSASYAGEVSALKAITGGDAIRFEQKNKQQAEPFVFKGMLMLAANQPIQAKDYTSAMMRRRTGVDFNYRVTEKDKARYKGGIEAKIKTQMSGLLNWLLSFDEHDLLDAIKNPSPRMQAMMLERELKSNPIAAWMNECLMPCAMFEHSYSGELYNNYKAWCEGQGHYPVSQVKFKGLVVDNANSKGLDVTAKDDSRGAYIEGLRLKRGGEYNKGLFVVGMVGLVSGDGGQDGANGGYGGSGGYSNVGYGEVINI